MKRSRTKRRPVATFRRYRKVIETATFDAILAGDLRHYTCVRGWRDYHVGDTLILREFNRASQTHTGRVIEADITFVELGGLAGLSPQYCVVSIDVTHTHLKLNRPRRRRRRAA